MDQDNQSPQPKRWHLDVFMLGMVGIIGYALWHGFPPGADALIAGIWGAGVFWGMLRWVRANQAALEAEDQARQQQRTAPALGGTPARTPALTPTQQHFLQVYPSETLQRSDPCRKEPPHPS